MKVTGLVRIVVLSTLTAILAGCAYPPPGRLVYGHCGEDAHTEAYPHAKDPKYAYGCKSDDNGYLEGAAQGDRPAN